MPGERAHVVPATIMADQNQPQGPPTATSAAEDPDGERPSAEDVAVDSPSVFRTISSVALNLATTAVVYAFGYWRIAAVSTWVLLPLMACVAVVRDRWREAGRLKRRRAQLAAAADEKTLVTANVSELPSWVFFPDIHRAEWLNQVRPDNVHTMPRTALTGNRTVYPTYPTIVRFVDHQADVAVGQRVRSKHYQKNTGTHGH